ncbi:VOC family protein [Actinomadura vinacea]|uniref:VOC family protein n=1 Tax=Actinomadura vinacea TaxID=115336 RepID=A0ABP5VG23_9ACTN
MPEITSYEPGSPNWVELSSPDIEASKAFYCELFDWSVYTVADHWVGDFSIFTRGDVTGPEVAGLTSLADDSISATWICYFSVNDADAAADAVLEAGGQVHMEPTNVAHMGRVVLAADTQGAGFGLWQPFAFPGAALFDEPNTVSWVELACGDTGKAMDFYGRVLGWSGPTEMQGVVSTYYVWRVGGRRVAGVVRAAGRRLSGDVPARWMPYFAVPDCEASVAQAERLGGTVRLPCTDTPNGRFSVLSDPTSATLAIIKRRFEDTP